MNREETIFEQALGIDSPAAREAYLREACAGDEPLFQSLERLLRVHDRAGRFLDPRPPAAEGAPNSSIAAFLSTAPVPAAERVGDRIGRYKLLEKIGEGGCGVVYMAEQEEPVRRRVALKVIKLGMDTEAVIARFEAERQALAMMDHPNIAKVLDAGATESLHNIAQASPPASSSGVSPGVSSGGGTPPKPAGGDACATLRAGRPYFVMELVRGTKITEFCDHNNLPTSARLDLFMQVCRAIQHAHQKGIIHRDIKPSNILVTLHDGVPVPKVIDFGIAKATQGRLTDKTIFTAFEQFIGTPAYMSPEQAEMSGLDIDTRSDIYSLGVLLYELLTGKTPFDGEELLQAGLDAMRRTIREKEPERPSTKLSTLAGGELTITANRRQTEPPKLVSSVRGDLDWIVMKCLEKDRARRYETANGLASDLQRHLDNEPVVARPPSNLYRFQKMVRRNKLAFAAGSAVTLSLLIALGLSTWMFFHEREAGKEQVRLREQAQAKESEARENERRAQTSEKKAQTEAVKSEQMSQVLRGMLKGVSPSVAKGRDTAMLREILDGAALQLDKGLTNQPQVEVELLLVLGETYYDLELYSQAEKMARTALDLGRQTLGEESLPVANAMTLLGRVLWRPLDPGPGTGLKPAETFTRKALALKRKLLGNDDPSVATSLNDLGVVLRGENSNSDAERFFRDALNLRRKLLGDENAEVATTLNDLALVIRNEGRLAEAEPMVRQTLAMRKKLLGEDHPDVAVSLRDLATILARSGKVDEAEAAYREAVDHWRRLYGAGSRVLSLCLHELAGIQARQGKLGEAETSYREALEIRRKLLGDSHGYVSDSLSGLANVLRSQGRLVEVLALYRELAEAGNVGAQERLARMYKQGEGVAKDSAEAFKWFQRLAETGSRTAQCALGLAYQLGEGATKDPAQAFKWFLKAAEGGDQVAASNVAAAYQLGEGVVKDQAQAARWLKTIEQFQRAGQGEQANNLAWFLATCEESEFRDGASAVAFAEKAVALTDRKNPYYLDTLAAAYAETGRFAEAVNVENEAITLLHDERLKTDFVSRLELYRSNSPCPAISGGLPEATALSVSRRAGLLAERGSLRAQCGQLKEAANDITRLVELEPTNHQNYHQLAPLLVATGDLEGYRRLCQEILARFSGTQDARTADKMAKDCLILPSSGADLGAVERLAETAVTSGAGSSSFPWYQFCKGLSQYRQGRFADAMDWMQKVLSQPARHNERDVGAQIVLAMAQYQLNQAEQARATLAQGLEAAETRLPKLDSGDLGAHWINWVIADALIKEAKALIEGNQVEAPISLKK